MSKGYRYESCSCGVRHAVHDPECDACGRELIPVFEPEPGHSTTQYADALEVQLSGGYGMHVDYSEESELRYLICGECASRLIEANPWMLAG